MSAPASIPPGAHPSATEDDTNGGEVAVTFKKKGAAANLRKRNREDAPAAAEDTAPSAVVAVEKTHKKDLSTFTTKTGRTEEKALRSAFQYSASNTAMSISDQKTFSYNTIDGDDDTKAAALKRKQEEEIITDPDDARLKTDAKTYKGMAGYSQYIEKKPSSVKAGPVKGPAYARITCRFDYQPDICKDYKETGYCGFGDSCKFMHDRGDYKSGWQLEKEWDDNVYGQANRENYEQPPEPEEEIPFACFLCREPFKNPVVTKCEHYFCESCALDQYKKNNKCAVCGAPTHGIFNVAHKLLSKMKKKKERDALKSADEANLRGDEAAPAATDGIVIEQAPAEGNGES